jgi:hypothetical protein
MDKEDEDKMKKRLIAILCGLILGMFLYGIAEKEFYSCQSCREERYSTTWSWSDNKTVSLALKIFFIQINPKIPGDCTPSYGPNGFFGLQCFRESEIVFQFYLPNNELLSYGFRVSRRFEIPENGP